MVFCRLRSGIQPASTIKSGYFSIYRIISKKLVVLSFLSWLYYFLLSLFLYCLIRLICLLLKPNDLIDLAIKSLLQGPFFPTAAHFLISPISLTSEMAKINDLYIACNLSVAL